MADSLRAKGRATWSCMAPLYSGTLCEPWVTRKFNKLCLCFLQPFHWVFGETAWDLSSVYGCVSTLLFSLSLVLQGSNWKSQTKIKDLRSTCKCEKFKSRWNFKSLNDLLEIIFEDELPSIYRHPRVTQGSPICGCMYTENTRFSLYTFAPAQPPQPQQILTVQWRTKAEQILCLSSATNTHHHYTTSG